MKNTLALLFVLLGIGLADELEEGHIGERFFHSAGIAVRLVGEDSVLVTFGASSEDLQNTVGVFPYEDEDSPHVDTANFRLFERKLETYLQERIPVRVDRKNLYLRVVQWKPDGKGREDGLDMKSLYRDQLFVTLGGRLPPKRSYLDITANIWIERHDAAETIVQFSLFQERQALRRLWTKRENTVRFPLQPDSLKAMRANPPPPLRLIPGGVDYDDHSGHDH